MLLRKTPHPDCGTRRPCGKVHVAAVTAIPGVVFSGSGDGNPHHSGIMPGNVFLAFGVE